jgi:ankyrin repeat protein
VRLLIERGLDVNAHTYGGDTALILASSNGLTEVVRLLLEHKANINARNDNGNDALTHASLNRHTDVVRVLTDAIRVAAARLIQTRWRDVNTCPTHPACRRRLKREFEDCIAAQ